MKSLWPEDIGKWEFVWDHDGEPMKYKTESIYDVKEQKVSDPPQDVEKNAIAKQLELHKKEQEMLKSLPVQDSKYIFEHPIPSRLFTIEPVDISCSNASNAQEYLARKIVTLPVVKNKNLITVCASCGRAINKDLCTHCFPFGICPICRGPLSGDGNCSSCFPYGICPICHNPRLVEDVCGNDYCRDQGPVVRCAECKHPIGITGECINRYCHRSQSHSFDCNTASCKKYCKIPRVTNEDDDSYESRDVREVACKLWNVNRNLSIAQEAINFYFAWGLKKWHDDQKAAEFLAELAKRDAKEFSSYFDLALGGELRHCMRYNGAYKARIPKWLQSEYPCAKSRPCAWLRWKDIRDEYGLDALRAAVVCFKLPNWPSSYGGNNWATIAHTLLEYLNGNNSNIVFLDSAFSLEHNCGCAFNKVYGTSYLKEALDICFDKKLPEDIAKSSLAHFIDPKLKSLISKYEQA